LKVEPPVREKRSEARIALELPGRYMLSSGEEFACDTVDISSAGMYLRGSKIGRPGERVIMYLDGLGRIEGRIVRRGPNVFAIQILASPAKRERISERIRWLMKSRTGATEERRRVAREDADYTDTVLRTEDGQEFPASLIELSLFGARIKVGARPAIGTRVVLGQKSAVVTRSSGDTLALRFAPDRAGASRQPIDAAEPVA
jgi:hypothetical protein